MTAFDTLFAAQAVPALFAQFGETIKYIPRDGAPRTVTAVIDRQPIQTVAEGMVAPLIVVKVSFDPTDAVWGGISVDEVDTGGDKVEVAWNKGEDPQQRSISRSMGVKGGMVILEVR